nr:hypothetical protein [Tanacetum cinerariifolium]
MAITQLLLLQELSRAADSHDIMDQLSLLLRREVVEDSKKMQDYYRLSSELSENVRIRDGYINEIHMKGSSNEVIECTRGSALSMAIGKRCYVEYLRRQKIQIVEKVRLSNDLTEVVRMRDGYINELYMLHSSNEVVKSIEIMRRMQVDDMETTSRLMLMAREMQTKVHEKNNFIMRLRFD